MSAEKTVAQTFIVMEFSVLRAASVKKAFDLLYKTFYVFNLDYAFELQPFFSFIDLLHDEEANASNTVREKFSLLFK